MTNGVSGANSIAVNQARMANECGRTVLWVGNEARGWTTADYVSAAQFAHAHGVDCLCVKVANGSIRWYGDVVNLANVRHAVLSRGVGFIPFLYSYGPALSAHQAGDEAAVVAEMLRVCPVVQLDMEAQWNGQVSAAAAFAAALRPLPGLVSVSTWGDPSQQNWDAVAHALSPSVNGWTPQDYTTWLGGATWAEYPASVYTCMQPGIDLSQEFGANDQAEIIRQAVAHGARTFYFWELGFARNNPGLLDTLVRLVDSEISRPSAPGGTPTPPAPTPPPAPSQPAVAHYTIAEGDTLSSIAARLHQNETTLLDENRGTLDDAAHAHGHPNCDNGNLIFPGTVLTYEPA